jgi:hypothetical protein
MYKCTYMYTYMYLCVHVLCVCVCVCVCVYVCVRLFFSVCESSRVCLCARERRTLTGQAGSFPMAYG